MSFGDFKYLTRRTASDKVLRDKAFNNAENPTYDGYQRGLASMIYIFFDKKTSGPNTLGSAVKREIMPNQEYAEQLHQPIIRKFKKRKVQSLFIGNVWRANLVVIQLISKFNKGKR